MPNKIGKLSPASAFCKSTKRYCYIANFNILEQIYYRNGDYYKGMLVAGKRHGYGRLN